MASMRQHMRLGDKETRQQGNMMIYVDAMQCCLNATLLAKNFVLGRVWQKASKSLSICLDRVLRPGGEK